LKEKNQAQIETEIKPKKYIFLSLLGMMLLSPCLEITAFYLAASPFGIKAFLMISIIFSVLTLSGILLAVYAGSKFIKNIESNFLNKHEKRIAGLLMLILGLYNWFHI